MPVHHCLAYGKCSAVLVVVVVFTRQIASLPVVTARPLLDTLCPVLWAKACRTLADWK